MKKRNLQNDSRDLINNTGYLFGTWKKKKGQAAQGLAKNKNIMEHKEELVSPTAKKNMKNKIKTLLQDAKTQI